MISFAALSQLVGGVPKINGVKVYPVALGEMWGLASCEHKGCDQHAWFVWLTQAEYESIGDEPTCFTVLTRRLGVALCDKHKPSVALYSIGTWDTDAQAYTPQAGLSVPSFNITLAQLRVAMRELRGMGYRCHRYRDADGDYDDNDWTVLIERTDGQAENEILTSWER